MADEKFMYFEETWATRKQQFGVTLEEDEEFDIQFKPLAYDFFTVGWDTAFKRAGDLFAMVEQQRKAKESK
jgi:hypothetical protein